MAVSNNEWAKLVRDALENLNMLLMEAADRDCIVVVQENPKYSREICSAPPITLTISERL